MLDVILGSLFFSTFLCGPIYSLYIISPIQPYLILNLNMTITEYNILYSSPYWLKWLSNSVSGYLIENQGETMALLLSSFIVLCGQSIFVLAVIYNIYILAFFGRLINGMNFTRIITEYLIIHYFSDNVPIGSNILGIMRALITIIAFITTDLIINNVGITYFLLISIIPSIFSLITSILYIPFHTTLVKIDDKTDKTDEMSLRSCIESITTLPMGYWLFILPYMLLTLSYFLLISNITLFLCEVYDVSVTTANYYALVQSIIYIIFGIPIGILLKKFKLHVSGLIIASLLSLISPILFMYRIQPLIPISIQGIMLLILNATELSNLMLSLQPPKLKHEYSNIELEPMDSHLDIQDGDHKDEIEATPIGVAMGLKESIKSMVLFLGFLTVGFTIDEIDTNSVISFDFTKFLILNMLLSIIGLLTGIIFLIYVKIYRLQISQGTLK